MGERALVLGGGGVTGIAWELGVLIGLREAGLDLTTADLVVGTSAGSAVGAHVAGGADLERLYAREVAARRETPKSATPRPKLDVEGLAAFFTEASSGAAEATEVRARIGRLALDAKTVPETERIEIIGRVLSSTDWPDRRLLVTGVDATTGEFVAWDRDSGVPLVLAVAASCAVPVVWPPITIDGRRYIDGGIRSGTNADLAAGSEAVVVIAPLPGAPTFPGTGLAAELASLGGDVRTAVVHPDEAAATAIGPNVLDVSRRAAAAEAGRAQGTQLAEVLRDVWG
jgi:NTE family protein